MTNDHDIPENETWQTTDAFGEDLTRLVQIDDRVPPEVDEQIRQHAREYFQREVRAKRLPRRILWPAVAAAAGLALVVSVILPFLQSDNIKPVGPAEMVPLRQQTLAQDIDASGQVDIVDCLVMARYIESGEPSNLAWDFTGDARLDQRDIDLVASAAVRLAQGVPQ